MENIKISIISPFHKPYEKYVLQAYENLKKQSYTNWELVLVPNNGAEIPFQITDDRVKSFYTDEKGIGRLKKFGSLKATGSVIIEGDIDDILLPNALEEVNIAFQNKDIVFAYSNSAQFEEDTWESKFYSSYYGWEHRPFEYEGHTLNEMISFSISAHMMRYIYWAPNHIRAWRKDAYEKIGGHNEELAVGDDHDLCCRFYIHYGAKGFSRINKCLYLYRLHKDNSYLVYNKEIQKQTDMNYCKHSRKIAIRWAKDNNLRLIDLGGRIDGLRGFETADRCKPADIVCDLNKKWKLKDNSVGVLNASHVFEHLKDSIHTMNEAYRVLAPGGWLFINVPSTDGRGAFQDPTHKSYFNQNSFLYYTDKNYSKYIEPEIKCRFQVSRIVTFFPNEIMKLNNIPVVQADLIALKGYYSEHPIGEVKI